MYPNRFNRILNGLNKLKKSTSMKDTMIVGLISGGTGAFVIELVNVLLGKRLFSGRIASSIVVHQLRSNRLKNKLYGELMHLTVGAGIGSVIAALLKKTSNEWAIIKGTFVSLFAWIGLYNLGSRMNLFTIKPHSIKNHYFSFIQHIIYGITTSAAIKYLTNPETFQHSSISKNESQISQRSLHYNQPFLPSEIEQIMPDSQDLQYKYPTA